MVIIEDSKEIVIMKSSRRFLGISYIFPGKEEINQHVKNVFIKFTLMYIIGIYYAIGVALHLIKNLKSKLIQFNIIQYPNS